MNLLKDTQRLDSFQLILIQSSISKLKFKNTYLVDLIGSKHCNNCRYF